MARTILVGLISSFLGASAAIWFIDSPSVEQPANATTVVSVQEKQIPKINGATQKSSAPSANNFQTGKPTEWDQLTEEERRHVSVYERTSRSVVNITTSLYSSTDFINGNDESSGKGSGSVLDREGHLLTNFHVIDGAKNIQVTLFDGKSYDAKAVGVDPQTDLAVLKIDAPVESLFPVVFGSSTGLRVGQRVYAIGNPFGFEQTLTTGIISSLNRTLPLERGHGKIKSLIQIDAAINPGNSGGPLLDSLGRLIGMNTAIASVAGDSAGIGFAIPVNVLGRLIPELIDNGRIVRADIGIIAVWESPEGLRIQSMVPGGPAERAGLRGPQVVKLRKHQGPYIFEYPALDRSAADQLVSIDGEEISDTDSLLEQIEKKNPGQRVVIGIIREGKKMEIPVTLDDDSSNI